MCRRPTRRGQRGRIFTSLPGAGCRGRGLGGEAVDGVIAPSTDHRPREEKLMARSSIMEVGACVMIIAAADSIVVPYPPKTDLIK
eukprot:1521814-Ditylum_brightwellii.AAC.1